MPRQYLWLAGQIERARGIGGVFFRSTDPAATAGAEVDDNEERTEFGDFGWGIDCDGRRFELWQPPVGQRTKLLIGQPEVAFWTYG